MEENFLKNGCPGPMSHEIRSRLSAITGFHNLLLETTLTPEQYGYVEGAYSSTETLLALINDLVDFSLIEAGQFTVDSLEFNLPTAIEEVMEGVALQAFGKGCEVYTLIHASVPENVKGDPARIRRVIANLTTAALDNAYTGEMLMAVRSVEETAERVAVRFDITGFGAELGPEPLQRLFQPLSSPQSAASWKYGRTGFELALLKQLVRMMGGQIGFSNVPEKGATFWFTVELGRCPYAVKKAGARLPSVEGMNVLLADPSPSGRRILVQYLESMGIACRDFAHAEDILADLAYSKGPPVRYDAMILALQQLSGAGLEVAARIRADELVKTVPLVLVTAIGSRGDAQQIRGIGAAAYLTRPLKRNQLVECMRMIRHGDTAQSTDAVAERPLITRHTIAEAKSGNRFRVLVADDNPSNRGTIRKYLDKAGYTCEVAENGADAVASFYRKAYDFVFLDCEMPVMDGFEAARAIRKFEAADAGRGRVPVCGMAASEPGAARDRCIGAGMDDCIVKPFGRAGCIAILEKWDRRPR